MIVLALVFAFLPDWTDALLEKGWTRAAVSNEAILFIRPGPRPNLHWQRQESRDPDRNGVTSIVSLVEVDCAGGKSRFIQGTYFRQRNLNGVVFSENVTEDWRYPAPDTIGDGFLKAACE